ncbi:MAG TPA: YwiC-like family protein [Thermodesulfovibrionales bacterium]|nr:YwiC-like family protein [Thermodesulfovibrionales bacterium]
MKRYVLKEYGSWGVMLMSFAAGLVVSRKLSGAVVAALFALALFINSKQALTIWMRSRGSGRAIPATVFFAHLTIATALMVAVAGNDIMKFAPYAVVPFAYILCLILLGEHALLTEVSGFMFLSLSSLMGRFAASGMIDPRLFLAVAVFFIAGVFKVRIQFRKEMRYRIMMIAYAAGSAVLYITFGLPLLLLVPLFDNILYALILYRTGLSTTGWLEVSKGLAFLVLLAFSYV